MGTYLMNAGILLATLAAMEGVAWAAHKYVMHGFGWGWHRSHHRPRHGWFEKNDLYALAFAGLAVALIYHGRLDHGPTFWMGWGMTAYGALYFLAHDGLVHGRIPGLPVPRRGYLARLYQAHRLHHAAGSRDGCVSFGFLYAPPVSGLRAQLKANFRRGRAHKVPNQR